MQLPTEASAPAVPPCGGPLALPMVRAHTSSQIDPPL
jgi:hypothetical protein